LEKDFEDGAKACFDYYKSAKPPAPAEARSIEFQER